ncbi:MAG: transposase [Gloeotrichia echinulata HAB0833]
MFNCAYLLNRNKILGDRRQGIKTSNRAKKYYQKLAKHHAHLANVRQDFLQKATTEISIKYYRIRIEYLNLSGMVANENYQQQYPISVL